MEKALYGIWVQKALGYHCNIATLMRYFGGAKALYDASEESLRLCGLFGEEIPVSKLSSIKKTTLEECKDTLHFCENCGISVVSFEDELYPKELLNIKDYPAVLYVKGDLSCLKDKIAVAVIGNRDPSTYGVETARKIARGISKEGAVIVSGGALGIDSVAHESAIEENGKTILVLGTGHLSGYLPENEGLRNKVALNGAVISEYPPNTKSTVYSFPKRNRIISGISKGVVIVEAGIKSGTLNTAMHAKNQGRDVFAVPGDVSSLKYAGSNRLITQGAKAVFSSSDVMNYYLDYFAFSNEDKTDGNPFTTVDKKGKETPQKSREKKAQEIKSEENDKKIVKITAESVSKKAFLVYNLMSGKEMSLDDIVRESKLTINVVLSCLTELEMESAIRLVEGGRYSSF